MSTVKNDDSFGNPTSAEKLGVFASMLLHLPIVASWTLLTSPFHPINRHKNWKRVIGDKAALHITTQMNVKQMQWLFGSTFKVYEDSVKAINLPVVVDELGEHARLLWIGERRTDKVILYIHGGGFLLAMQPFATSFWIYVKNELKNKINQDVGLVILNYTLVPAATFPTQLTQIVLAVQHLISTGVDPKNIQITGDSAGGNLILQLVSHFLHPVANVPTITLSSPIRSIYLMSPWISLNSETGSMISNNGIDWIGKEGLLLFGRVVLDGVPEVYRPLLDAANAPEGWFDRIGTIVERLLITAGNAECLRDEIEVVAKRICAVHDNARFVKQKYGLHDDPHMDFVLPGKNKVGELTPLILEWLAAGFE